MRKTLDPIPLVPKFGDKLATRTEPVMVAWLAR